MQWELPTHGHGKKLLRPEAKVAENLKGLSGLGCKPPRMASALMSESLLNMVRIVFSALIISSATQDAS